MCDTTKTSETHPFTKVGLGEAPFRYIGMIAQNVVGDERIIGDRDGIKVTTKPGGTCDACGTYIVDMYRIKSSDGIISTVGSDCILKVATKVEAVNQLKADLKKAAKVKAAARKVKEAARITEAVAAFYADVTLFTDKPHPTAWRAQQGDTFRSYVGWMLDNAGHSGKFSIAKLIEKTIG